MKEREQFGVPDRLVPGGEAPPRRTALKELSFARPAVYRAAYSVADGEPDGGARRVDGEGDGVRRGARSWRVLALQCHGAIGYTVEYDLHLCLKRTWALSRAWGDADAGIATASPVCWDCDR